MAALPILDDVTVPQGSISAADRQRLGLFGLIEQGAVVAPSPTPVLVPPLPSIGAITLGETNRFPDAGYLFPLLPREWMGPTPVRLQALCRVGDDGLDLVRRTATVTRQAHVLPTATGGDLDDLGALLGLPRQAGEGDETYRVRLPATVQHGIGAVTRARMVDWLTATCGVAVSVDEPGMPAQAVLTLYGTPHIPLASVMPLVRRIAPFGVALTGRVAITRPRMATTRLGTFRLATQRLGGSSQVFVPLPG